VEKRGLANPAQIEVSLDGRGLIGWRDALLVLGQQRRIGARPALTLRLADQLFWRTA